MTLLEKIKNMKTSEITAYVKDKKFKVISNASGSRVPVGEYVTITGVSKSNNLYGGTTLGTKRLLNNATAGWCGLSELLCPSSTIKSLLEENEYINNEILKLKESISNNNIRIKFMRTNKLKEFDDTDFKIFKTLEALEDGKLSKLDKVKLISSLIKE